MEGEMPDQMETEQDEQGLPVWLIVSGAILALLTAYPLGYLFTDVLRWVDFTPEQAQGDLHVCRLVVGALVIAVVGSPFIFFTGDRH